MEGTRAFRTLILALAVAWHVLSVLTPAWVQSFDQKQARDFASYYYAYEVARRGDDPYDTALLSKRAQDDGFRKNVHPFLYAPPFLLGMTWASGLDLPEAYRLWFWLDELCALAAALILWRWWRPLSPDLALVLIAVGAAMTAIPNNHTMGQANFPGLALALAGLWAVDRDREALGGALMGAACMWKMSPALFLLWWAVDRRWRPIGFAVATGAALSLAALPLVGPAAQWGFYTQVLPTFSSGAYNGLAVPIGLFGNHSLPNVVDALAPGSEHQMSGLGRLLSGLTTVALLAGVSSAFRDPERAGDAFHRAARASCFAVLLLLVPVFTYEHHLVFAVPAAVVVVLAVIHHRLPSWTWVPAALCVGLLVADLQLLKGIVEGLPKGLSALRYALQELKFLALLGLVAITTWLGSPRLQARAAAVRTAAPSPAAA